MYFVSLAEQKAADSFRNRRTSKNNRFSPRYCDHTLTESREKENKHCATVGCVIRISISCCTCNSSSQSVVNRRSSMYYVHVTTFLEEKNPNRKVKTFFTTKMMKNGRKKKRLFPCNFLNISEPIQQVFMTSWMYSNRRKI